MRKQDSAGKASQFHTAGDSGAIRSRRFLLQSILLLLAVVAVLGLTWKMQYSRMLKGSVKTTLTLAHKPGIEATLNVDAPVGLERFICEFPNLKKISMEGDLKDVDPAARIHLILQDPSTGETLYEDSRPVSLAFEKETDGKKLYEVTWNLREGSVKSLEGEIAQGTELLFWVSLEDAGTTSFTVNCSGKELLVTEFNQDPNSHLNLIHSVSYADRGYLKSLYLAVSVLILLLVGSAWVMVIGFGLPIHRCYPVFALILGVILQFVIPLNGVPDESGHMDTAYHYSNVLMGKGSGDTAATVQKRICDERMAELLANDVESGNYYQVWDSRAREADKAELTVQRMGSSDETGEVVQPASMISVPYTKTSGMVMPVFYLPGALGITIGRAAGCSSAMTYQLGRLMSLLFFVIFTSLSVWLVPFGKNFLALIGLLPIVLQQAASFSYDSMMLAMIFLFFALLGRLLKCDKARPVQLILPTLLALGIVFTKGAVYVPLALLLPLVVYWIRKDGRTTGQADSHSNSKAAGKKGFGFIFLVLAVLILIAALVVWKFRPFLKNYIGSGIDTSEKGSQITVGYLITQPVYTLWLYWNSLVKNGGQRLSEILGNGLGWRTIEVSWLFLASLLGGLLLFPDVEQDRPQLDGKMKAAFGLASVLSAFLVITAMLFGYASTGSRTISGIQGRYYIPIVPFVLSICESRMIHVDEKGRRRIWMVMILALAMIVLQIPAQAA